MNNWLLLEGYTDRELFSFFAAKWKLDYDCNPKKDNGNAINGVDDLITNSFPDALNRFKGGDIDRLGIFVDSDDNPSKRKQDIEAHLNTLGFVNSRMVGSGWIYEHSVISGFCVGVLILPSISQNGELEDILVEVINSHTKTHFDHCDDLISTLQSEGLRQDKKESKAKIYTLLASQDKPSANFSYLGSDNLIDINNPSIQGIKTWLEEVYK